MNSQDAGGSPKPSDSRYYLEAVRDETYRLAAEFQKAANHTDATSSDHDRAQSAATIVKLAERKANLLDRDQTDARLQKLAGCKTEAELAAAELEFQTWARDCTLRAWGAAVNQLLALKDDRSVTGLSGQA